ncbi:MAG: hypothetical protein H7331_09030 [Bacteroidia bacterium]|nr:hypothetical protein [Bacteroidia bacterium]
MTLILRLRSVTSLTLARANQFNNKLWNTCGNGANYTVRQTPNTAAATGTPDTFTYSINVTTTQVSSTTTVTPAAPSFSSPGLPVTPTTPIVRTTVAPPVVVNTVNSTVGQ